jgi:hypothetical protein
MWSYYGAKTNTVDLYPPPKYAKIIEPFAGTARYALKYWDKDVLLIDKYDVIIKIWKWLQVCSRADIIGMPRIKEGQNINNFKFDCEEARLLMGFCIGFGFMTPRHLATPKQRHRPNFQNYTLNRIANNLHKIRHWKMIHGSYEDVANETATWFIDPPYQFGGHAYKESNKNIDFKKLADWSLERGGQIIVCENSKADWLPFIPLAYHYTHNGHQHEVFYTNEKTSYGVQQLKIF